MPDESGRMRALSEVLLEKWSRTRGPLFARPSDAVCRILAIREVDHARSRGPERALRIRAARILHEALAEVPASNRPATREQHARVNMALVDIERALREPPEERKLVQSFAKILAIADGHGRDFNKADVIGYLALAELLAAATEDDSWELSLRAARTLLARTRDAARRVGAPAAETPQSNEPQSVPDETEPEAAGDDSSPHPTRQHYECAAASGAGPP